MKINFDGINIKTKTTPNKLGVVKKQLLPKVMVATVIKANPLVAKSNLESLKKSVINYSIIRSPIKTCKVVWEDKNLFRFYQNRLVLGALVITLCVAFSGGMWVGLNTQKTKADIDAAQSIGESPVHQPIILSNAIVSTSTVANISNDVLFNTPIELLQQYFTSPVSQAEIINSRKAKLKDYLAGKSSPLLKEADTIAQQDHWKLILAISFAESTLGKHCYLNNCSGIGGSQIRTYNSLKSWILDFNRLLEKRYKDKTLEQMCGVYVQPCNPNWLLATRQILGELDDNKIE